MFKPRRLGGLESSDQDDKRVRSQGICKRTYVNVVRGLKLYENILTHTELTRLNEYVNKLRVAGKKWTTLG
ncbi:hypothetical protein Lser_V15G41660 [Lactuca serriola]